MEREIIMKFRKFFTALTAVILCLTFSSCGKRDNEQISETAVTENEKKIVSMYVWNTNSDIEKAASDFNSTSEEYRVEITDYTEKYPDEPLMRLSNDITIGNLPDIILLNSYDMPVKNYISKGLLANLYDFMESDESFNKEDYLENYFKAYEVEGKLYEISPEFAIQTIMGKTSVIGETQGWTMNEFISFAEENSDKNIFSGVYNKGNVLTFFINSCCGDYFSIKTGECRFNSEDFIELLEFCNSFPNETSENFYENIDTNEYETQWRTGSTLLDFCLISDFTSLRRYEAVTFGGSVTVKGFPSEEKSGLSFNNYGIELAVTAKAANGEGAWEFIKYFLSDKYQDKSNMFPIKLSSIEKKAEASKERPFFTDESGSKIYTDTETIGGQEVNIGVNTNEDIRRVTEIINSADSTWHYDSQITKIITEEAAAYFAGQKSAEDVAEIIQNRVQNYLDENR